MNHHPSLNLKKRELKALDLYNGGLTYEQIGKALKTTRQGAQWIIRKAREKLVTIAGGGIKAQIGITLFERVGSPATVQELRDYILSPKVKTGVGKWKLRYLRKAAGLDEYAGTTGVRFVHKDGKSCRTVTKINGPIVRIVLDGVSYYPQP